MSTLATTNIKHDSASTPNITLTSGGATTVNGTLNLGSSPLATPTGSAPSYTCRAWVNFNGTGTVAIRASGNVSSITDYSTGRYGINFSTSLPDANYAIAGFARDTNTTGNGFLVSTRTGVDWTTSQVTVDVYDGINAVDSPEVTLLVFR
jgi:hypothetical protein